MATSGEVPTLLGEALKALKSTLYRPRLLALMLVKLAGKEVPSDFACKEQWNKSNE
jgi:hypothetical protein